MKRSIAALLVSFGIALVGSICAPVAVHAVTGTQNTNAPTAEPQTPEETTPDEYMVATDEDDAAVAPASDTVEKTDKKQETPAQSWNVPILIGVVIILLGIGGWMAMGKLD